MSDSSFEDAEKGNRYSKDTGSPHLTQQQEDLLEASEPPFTEHDHDDEEHKTAGLRKVVTGASMQRVPSSKPSVNNIRSVPNGGTKAWLQVLASFFLFFNSWGIVNTFGMLSKRTFERNTVLLIFNQEHIKPTMRPVSWLTPRPRTSHG